MDVDSRDLGYGLRKSFHNSRTTGYQTPASTLLYYFLVMEHYF